MSASITVEALIPKFVSRGTHTVPVSSIVEARVLNVGGDDTMVSMLRMADGTVLFTGDDPIELGEKIGRAHAGQPLPRERRKPGPSGLSAEMRAAAIERVRAGETRLGVALDVGVCAATLREWCRQAGIPGAPKPPGPGTKGYPPEVRQRALDMLADGRIHIRNIAAEIGVREETIREWHRRALAKASDT